MVQNDEKVLVDKAQLAALMAKIKAADDIIDRVTVASAKGIEMMNSFSDGAGGIDPMKAMKNLPALKENTLFTKELPDLRNIVQAYHKTYRA